MSMSTNKFSRFFIWIILALVMVGLIGFGSFNFGGRIDSVGTVGETEIGADRYFREVNNQIRAFEAQTGQSLPFAQAQAFGLDQLALQTVIAQVALEDETARLGISVGDEELATRIRDIESFAGIDGRFDRETYSFVLEQSGLTASEFEESLRAEVARTIIQGAVANGIGLQGIYTDTLFGWAREARDFTWAKVGEAALDAPVGVPDDAQLQTYYEANPADFTLPQVRNITYVWLTPEDVLDDIAVDESELRALYDSRIDEYRRPERRIVERLVFGTKAEAEDAAARLAAGESFEMIVAERGLSLSDVDLGDMTANQIGTGAEDVFALPLPGVTGVIESDLGPAIYRVNVILNAQETTFEEVADQLKAEYAADAARRLLSDLVLDLDDALAGGATLEDLAAERDMTLATIAWTGAQTDGIAAYDGFREAADSVRESDYPEIADLSDGGLFALRLDSVEAPRLQTLDEVRDAAIAGWQAQERGKRVFAAAEEMVAAFAKGETPENFGLTENTEKGLTRDAFIGGAPAALIDTVFEIAAGEWAVLEDAEGAVLVRLDAVHAPDFDSDEARAIRAAFAESTAQALALDVQAAFATALEIKAGITLDRAMINAVNASMQ